MTTATGRVRADVAPETLAAGGPYPPESSGIP
jgi:hypothetical protein